MSALTWGCIFSHLESSHCWPKSQITLSTYFELLFRRSQWDIRTKWFKTIEVPLLGSNHNFPHSSSRRRQSTRLSKNHELSVTEADKKDIDERPQRWRQDWHPAAKRRSARARRLSQISTTSGVSSSNARTEEDEKSQISYRTVTPPSNSEYPGWYLRPL